MFKEMEKTIMKLENIHLNIKIIVAEITPCMDETLK